MNVKEAIRLAIVTAATSIALAVVPSASFAGSFECPYSESPFPHHCYAIAEWNDENLGVQSIIRTFFASVPEPETSFVNNEMWDNFSRGGWVEAGDKAGYGDGRKENVGFDYFTAQDIPPGYETEGYYEYDFTYGPEADYWFEDTLHAAGYGVWYIYLNGSHVWSWGSQPGAASYAQDGMEATDDNIYATGQSANFAYWSTSNGARYEGWPGDFGFTSGHTCVHVSEVNESFSNESC
jgi:hypothetical protein